ncbi:cilia-and flagella-associated protein 96-like [Watersipora subatra]|uniref:cilia-and flagella-associated protein 96-like n=1 Tax=Watersipora subatra TaxID=2589382 RepID=UPI00355B9544
MGDKGGKTDMERMGIFQEMKYHTIGDKYATPALEFNVAAGKGKQVLPGGNKERCAKQDGYFNDKFVRMFEGEAYSDPIKQRRQHRMKESQKNLGKPFLPSNGDKKPSGLGNHYGTLGGAVPFFSAQNKTGAAYKSPNKNLYTNPGKRGTGFGYLNVTLGQFPKHMTEPYDQVALNDKKLLEQSRSKMKGGSFKLNMHPKAYFDEKPYTSEKPLPPAKKSAPARPIAVAFRPSHPAKKPAGCKAGTFETYPQHSVDPYGKHYKRPVNVVNKTGKTFMPNQGPKSALTNSIINQNVVRTMNRQNYKTVRSVTVH